MSMVDILLRHARPVESAGLEDIAVDQGRIVSRGPRLSGIAKQEFDLEGRLLIPGFVEAHLHLDMALTVPRDRPGRLESFSDPSVLSARARRTAASFTREDIEGRAGMALEMASRHGVTALRAQCSLNSEIGLRHVEALLSVKQKYADRVTLQIVASPNRGLLTDLGAPNLVRAAIHAGADIIGCSPSLEKDYNGRNFRPHIDASFALAIELGVDLDAHVDLGIPDEVAMEDLEVAYLAQRAIEVGYSGRVVAGHLCALGSAQPDLASRVIELVHRAQISVLSMPDLYRLGRGDRRHVRRGLTRVKELLEAGVNVAYASNNVRDVHRPMGDFDLLQEGLVLAYGAHMDTVEDLETIVRMSTYNAAQALRLEQYGLGVGSNADMVVLDAPSASAAVVDQADKQYVFKLGRLVAGSVPVGSAGNRRTNSTTLQGTIPPLVRRD